MNSKNVLLALAGALFGAAAGIGVFSWLVHNFAAYGFAIPGVATGLGASVRAELPKAAAVTSGIIGLLAGVFATWKEAPFVANGSFGYFLTHLHDLPSYQMLLLALGAVIAFWLPWRRRAR